MNYVASSLYGRLKLLDQLKSMQVWLTIHSTISIFSKLLLLLYKAESMKLAACNCLMH